MKQYTLTNRLLAGVSFLITLITYTLTLQPSVPFWDCGEFSAATAWQQVPHPPGAPLFLIVGRWFHMLPFGDPGWRINMVSAIASAFTAFLCYLIIVKMIERWRPYREGSTLSSYLPTFGGAMIGTLAFTWCDTQWFNSVESEVYAAGTTLIAAMVWLMMRWNEEADKPGHERYLLLIAYLTGLAFGIHLLALLVIPAVALVIYFRTFRTTMLGFAITLGITAVVFYVVVYTFPLQVFPKWTADSLGVGALVVAALVGGLWWGIRNKKSIVALSVASMLLIFLGFSTYTHILVRANAHPPMNENEPDTIAELVKYMNREQYGYAPNWPRRYQEEQYYRSRQDRYGDWYPPTGRDEKGRPIFERVNTMGELNFMFQYQISQMYVRYLLWNFIGRVSDVQNAGVAWFGTNAREKAEFISPTGYDDVFPVRFFALPFLLGLFGFYHHFKRDWKMGVVYGALFLLLGILATLQQNQQEPQPRERDYFYVGSFMVFAMWIGIGAAGLAERFGFGQKASDDDAEELFKATPRTGIMAATLAVALLAAPINMAVGGWKLHDRSHIWVPWDYSYNILQSVEKDAIVFTNGDNDTFPLWYLQDVAGVRRDVRVVNLSLGQTAWYIYQLKNERPWGAKKVPVSFSDQILKVPEGERGGITPREMRPDETGSVEVPAAVMRRLLGDSSAQGTTMTWKMSGMDWGGSQVMGVQHQLVRDIIQTNKWERPIYFSTSTGNDVWCGLESYFRQEGLAYRIMPVQQGSQGLGGSIEPTIMRKCLMETLPADKHYTEPHYGFKFRNLTDRSLFFGEDHRRLMISFRTNYLALANHELNVAKDPKAAIATLDKLESVISPEMFGMPYPLTAEIANIYKQAGDQAKASKYAQQAIRDMDALGGDDPNTNIYAERYPPALYRGQMLAVMGDYDQAIKYFSELQQKYPTDMSVRAQAENYRIEKYLAKKDTMAAVAEIDKIIAEYGVDTSQAAQVNLGAYRQKKTELLGKGGLDSAASVPTDTARR